MISHFAHANFVEIHEEGNADYDTDLKEIGMILELPTPDNDCMHLCINGIANDEFIEALASSDTSVRDEALDELTWAFMVEDIFLGMKEQNPGKYHQKNLQRFILNIIR